MPIDYFMQKHKSGKIKIIIEIEDGKEVIHISGDDIKKIIMALKEYLKIKE